MPLNPLVTLTEAKEHLYITENDDDNLLNLKIFAASNTIRRYLGDDGLLYEYAYDSNGDLEEDSDGEAVLDTNGNGDYIVRYDVKAACLLLIGEMYRNREGTFTDTAPGKLPPAVESILSQLRDPVMA